MRFSEIINEDKAKIRKVKKTRADDSVEITFEVLNSDGVTVKTGMSKETASKYLEDHSSKLNKE